MILLIIEEGLNLTKGGRLLKRPKALYEKSDDAAKSVGRLEKGGESQKPAGEGFLSERLNRFFVGTQVQKTWVCFLEAYFLV